MRWAYAGLADVTMGVHFLFLAYLVTGGFVAWRWRRTIWGHLAAAAWALISITVGVTCPLTVIQDWARHGAGEPGLPGGFVAHYLTGVVYPRAAIPAIQAGVAVVIAVSWLGLYLRARRRSRPAVSDSFKTPPTARP